VFTEYIVHVQYVQPCQWACISIFIVYVFITFEKLSIIQGHYSSSIQQARNYYVANVSNLLMNTQVSTQSKERRRTLPCSCYPATYVITYSLDFVLYWVTVSTQ
jgi:hypothetical protein